MNDRTLRYVEMDANGNPFHEATSGWAEGPTEDEAWAVLVEDAAAKGHTVVRLLDSRYATNPNLNDIEGDGKGGFRAKAGKTLKGVTLA